MPNSIVGVNANVESLKSKHCILDTRRFIVCKLKIGYLVNIFMVAYCDGAQNME